MTDSKYRLISHIFCPYVQRARIVMLEKQIPHELEYIDLESPPGWFYDVSPLEKVPILMVGEEALFESMPICEYLDEVSPGSLYDEDPLQRARQRAWIAFGDSLLDQQYDLFGAVDEKRMKQARARVMDSFDILEDELGKGPFFSGAAFGMVDAVFAPLFRNFRVLEDLGVTFVDANDTPRLAQWSTSLLQRPSVIDAVTQDYPAAYTASVRGKDSLIARRLSD